MARENLAPASVLKVVDARYATPVANAPLSQQTAGSKPTSRIDSTRGCRASNLRHRAVLIGACRKA